MYIPSETAQRFIDNVHNIVTHAWGIMVRHEAAEGIQMCYDWDTKSRRVYSSTRPRLFPIATYSLPDEKSMEVT